MKKAMNDWNEMKNKWKTNQTNEDTQSNLESTKIHCSIIECEELLRNKLKHIHCVYVWVCIRVQPCVSYVQTYADSCKRHTHRNLSCSAVLCYVVLCLAARSLSLSQWSQSKYCVLWAHVVFQNNMEFCVSVFSTVLFFVDDFIIIFFGSFFHIRCWMWKMNDVLCLYE